MKDQAVTEPHGAICMLRPTHIPEAKDIVAFGIMKGPLCNQPGDLSPTIEDATCPACWQRFNNFEFRDDDDGSDYGNDDDGPLGHDMAECDICESRYPAGEMQDCTCGLSYGPCCDSGTHETCTVCYEKGDER